MANKQSLSYVDFYAALCIAVAYGFPLYLTVKSVADAASPGVFYLSVLLWGAGMPAVWYWLVRYYISGRLSYWQTMRSVCASMMTGWAYVSLFLIFPALWLVFMFSITLMLYHGMGDRTKAQERLYQLAMFFRRHRMRQ